LKWNDGVSFPIESGHGCLGCSEPDFWDQDGGFYTSLAGGKGPGWRDAGIAAAVGITGGAAAAFGARHKTTRPDVETPE
jgi:hydrogenase small subunit